MTTIHPDQNLVFFVQHWDYKLISYDMDRKEVCTLCTVGCYYGFIDPYAPYFSENCLLKTEFLNLVCYVTATNLVTWINLLELDRIFCCCLDVFVLMFLVQRTLQASCFHVCKLASSYLNDCSFLPLFCVQAIFLTTTFCNSRIIIIG